MLGPVTTTSSTREVKATRTISANAGINIHSLAAQLQDEEQSCSSSLGMN